MTGGQERTEDGTRRADHAEGLEQSTVGAVVCPVGDGSHR